MIRVPLQSPDFKNYYHIENAPIGELITCVQQWIHDKFESPIVYLKHPDMYISR